MYMSMVKNVMVKAGFNFIMSNMYCSLSIILQGISGCTSPADGLNKSRGKSEMGFKRIYNQSQ